MTTPTSEDGTPGSLLDDQIEPFLKHLRDAGYAERTLRKKRTVTRAFARWAKRKQIAGNDLNDSHVAAFASRSPRNRKAHVKFELAVLRLFFEYPARLRRSATATLARLRFCRRHPASETTKIIYGRTAGSRRTRCLSMCPFIRDFLAVPDHPNGPGIPGVIRYVDRSGLHS